VKRCYLKQARSANDSAGPVVLLVLAAGLKVIPARGIETGPIAGYPEQSLSSYLIGCRENVTVVAANGEELRIKGE
jgi:hypothetical protein